jgi:hypothetical protein
MPKALQRGSSPCLSVCPSAFAAPGPMEEPGLARTLEANYTHLDPLIVVLPSAGVDTAGFRSVSGRHRRRRPARPLRSLQRRESRRRRSRRRRGPAFAALLQRSQLHQWQKCSTAGIDRHRWTDIFRAQRQGQKYAVDRRAGNGRRNKQSKTDRLARTDTWAGQRVAENR